MFVLSNKINIAQHKYALLIGINEYQIKDSTGKTVLDPRNALYGCVNDALSMKEVLINKFNFPSNNITTLLNTKASRVNILKQIDLLLAKCKNGDVAVVYFAGHGMPYRYGNGVDDIAEVILPSNAFATMPFSCIQQAELAKKFNLFVDKKITLTTIFDCCFSLATSSRGILMLPEMLSLADSSKNNSTTDDNWIEPLEMEPADADEYELLPNDSILNAAMDLPAKSSETIQNRGLSLSQYQEMTRHVLPYGFVKADTTFNPPSQREQSQFIFLSATNDKQKAPEMRDENGKKRGAFTLAFTKVIESQAATASFKEIFNKTVLQLKAYGKEITPSVRFKQNQRENKNLFGLPPAELKLKLYLSNESYTQSDLNAIYKKWIIPFNNDSLYQKQLFTKSNPNCSKIYIINQGKSVNYINAKTKKSLIISSPETLKKYLKNQAYVFYLPVPKAISDAIRKECLQNKQIELVSDLSKADLSVYCTNYTPNKKNIFDKALDFGKEITDDIINYDYKDELSFVGSNETVGKQRKKAGHTYSVNDHILIPATSEIKIIVKKINDWLNKKISQ